MSLAAAGAQAGNSQVVALERVLSVVSFTAWIWALFSVVRAKPYAWRAAPGTREGWFGALFGALVVQWFLPRGGFALPTLLAALLYLALARPKLRRRVEERDEKHHAALNRIRREFASRDDADGDNKS